MPTPVSSARQCLTEEAARALDDAVAVARRRSHSQTTSLHAVSALLSLTSSTLRDACARARSSAYSPRLQFRALELCVSVSLDRIPSTNSKAVEEEPPVSNSLMAAIKRSQANQRRHPETFHLYQMHQQQLNSQSSSLSCVKVELKHFILSILDDPIVSRVFGDAGFRSSDIKFAILQPPPVSRFQKSMRFPPMFLCNLSDSDSNRSGFNFPFAVDNGEEDFKRIGQVLAKKTSKNPLLVGVSANNVLAGFTDSLKKGKGGFLPGEIGGLDVMSMDKEIGEFVAGKLSEEMMGLKFKEVRDKVESCAVGGVVVNFGELKVFVDGGATSAAVDYVVSQLSSLVKAYGGKLWLIGAVGSYETYMKFSAKFSSIEKDWDLNLLPITSSNSNISGLHLKSSLMGSFVPFGGFFPAPTELGNPSNSTIQSVSRCDLCNEKYEHEVSVILKGGRGASVADQQSTSLPSWLQTPESEISKGLSTMEAKDHTGVLNARVLGLQRKWNDICQRLHQGQRSRPNSSEIRARIPFPEHFRSDNCRVDCNDKDANQYESRCRNIPQSIRADPQKTQSIHQSDSSDADNSLQHKPVDFLSTTKHTSNSSSSITSVTTDLGLGMIYVSPEIEPRQHDHRVRLQDLSGSIYAEIDDLSKNASDQMATARPSEKDFKLLYRALADKVGDQDDAICAISQTISRCRTGSIRDRGSGRRKDIWIMFIGPDLMGKKKTAAALAEVVFGSRESLISIDLDFENRIHHSPSIFDGRGVNFCDLTFRGKTVMDYIAEELSKKPQSVVFLENIDKADFLVQNSLSQAIRTGKLADTRGREISTNNAVFLTTSSSSKEMEEALSSGRELWGYSEERVLKAKAMQMQILVASVGDLNSSNVLLVPKQSTSTNPTLLNKRKHIETSEFNITIPAVKKSKSCFDLNIPVEEAEGSDDCGNSESDSVPETKEVWLEEFLEQVDEKVVFKPFDFDSLAESVLKEIGLCFQKTVGSNVLLEIDNEVMVQILASYWVSDQRMAVKEWIDTVLRRGFMEVQRKECFNSESLVKLIAVECHNLEEHAQCFCLPGRIVLN